MNFQNLEYFVAVAHEGSITRAAEKLNITQQALSNQIARLEQELGCALFDRKNGFELTYSGRCFRDSAVQILDINRQTESILNDINENRRGELKIGISHTRGQAVLPLLLPDFISENPQVSLSVVEASTRQLEQELDRGSIDIMIGFKPFMLEQADSVDLYTEHLFIVAPKSLMEANLGKNYSSKVEEYKKSPNLALFKNAPFVLLKKGDRIRAIVDSEFSKAGVIPDVKLETGNVQTAFSLAARGIGLAVVPELYLHSPYIISGNKNSDLRNQVEILPFTSEPSQIAIGYHSDRYLSAPAQDFIKLATAKFKEL